jgi:hypothetical protein
MNLTDGRVVYGREFAKSLGIMSLLAYEGTFRPMLEFSESIITWPAIRVTAVVPATSIGMLEESFVFPCVSIGRGHYGQSSES